MGGRGLEVGRAGGLRNGWVGDLRGTCSVLVRQ